MPSLGGRVPQVRDGGFKYLGTARFNALFGRTGPAGHRLDGNRRELREFQCPLWADGSRRFEQFVGTKCIIRCFNALFGRTGPAGPPCLKMFARPAGVSMPSLGGRVPQGARQDARRIRAYRFNALFGRTGPAGPPPTPTIATRYPRCFNALFGRTGPAGVPNRVPYRR